MIGVISKRSETWAVREFFELFKTPWEFYLPNKAYDLAIVTREEVPDDLSADALVIYNTRNVSLDHDAGVGPLHSNPAGRVEWQGRELFIYGGLAVFQSVGQPLVTATPSSEVVGSMLSDAARPTVRIGFNLFEEVAFLLTHGQPKENARFATLETHISLLRAVMPMLEVPFVEIPPVPAGYEFAACLTHDVDFVGIRDHKFDQTMWGFLYRATFRSLLKVLTGKLSWSKYLRNCAAAISLPLVHLGICPDFWLEFERYMKIERGLGSTFFFLPFRNAPGTIGPVAAPKRRGAKYDVAEIKGHIDQLLSHGCEIGLHGIDAWQDLDRAAAEQQRIRELTLQTEVGIRMHWLYWREDSPITLDRAGFTYDSTFGYNDAIGFRAGTAQPFSPRAAERLLEVPLNIQDSAMFYSDRMRLSETEAQNGCREIISTMCRSGGVLIVNWHTRSLSPERLWGEFYDVLLREMQAHRVWFGTMQRVLAWYRKRRALRFEKVDFEENGIHVALQGPPEQTDPAFNLKAFHPKFGSVESRLPGGVPAHTVIPWVARAVVAYGLP